MSSPAYQAESNIGSITIICGWTFTVVATIAVSLLPWAHRLHNSNLGVDDYFLIVAYTLTVILMGQITWAIIDDGQGQHVTDVPRTQLALVASSLLANETLWGLVNTLIRISALIFTRRMFGAIRLVRICADGLIVLSVLYGLVVVLEIFLICQPLAAAWDNNINGDCGKEVISYVVLETFGLMLDLAILVLPLRSIWPLYLPRRRKIGLGCVFSVGAIVVIITGLRIKALHMVTSADFTYARGYLGLLSVLGALLSIIACCVPCIPAIYDTSKQAASRNTLRCCHFFRTRVSLFRCSTREPQEHVLTPTMLGSILDVEGGSITQQDEIFLLKNSKSAVTEDTIAADKTVRNSTITANISVPMEQPVDWLAVVEV